MVPERVRCDFSYLADPSIPATAGVLWETVRYLFGSSPE
jgi:hypothetical protein